MTDIRNIVSFAKNEELLREYSAFRMFVPIRKKINLSITTHRLIVYSSDKSMLSFQQDALYQEINIHDVRGLEILQSKTYSVNLMMFFGFLSILGFLFQIFKGLENIGIGLILGGIVGIVGCLFFPTRKFKFVVRGLTSNLNVGEFADIKPLISDGPDLNKIVQELGALILEIQKAR